MIKVPKLRFNGFSQEWSNVCFKDLFQEVIERTNNTDKYNLYSLTIENGVVPKTERYEREFLVTKKEENYKVVHKDEYVYNPMNIRFGAVARHIGGKPVSVSGYYNVFKTINNDSYGFWDNFLKTNRMLYIYNTIATGSLIEKRRVHFSQFIELDLPIPSLGEQRKISQFFSIIDRKILKQKEKVDALQKYKKGIIQKVFSQKIKFNDEKGGSYPEWKEQKLGKLIKQKSIRNKSQEINLVLSVSNSRGFIAQTDQFEDRDVASSDISNYKIVEKNDFAFNPARINVGSIAKLKLYERGIISPMYVCFSCENFLNDSFMEYFLKTYSFEIQMKKRLEGSVRQTLSFDAISEIKIFLPSMKEQNKIVDLLCKIDDKIKREQDKLDLLDGFKKGLLQQMFI